MPNIGGWPSDSSNLVASQFATKNYFHGELSGARLVLGKGPQLLYLVRSRPLIFLLGLQELQKDSPAESSVQELHAFKSQMSDAVNNIRRKTKPFTVPEIRRILLRAVSVLVASPRVNLRHFLSSIFRIIAEAGNRWTAIFCTILSSFR